MRFSNLTRWALGLSWLFMAQPMVAQTSATGPFGALDAGAMARAGDSILYRTAEGMTDQIVAFEDFNQIYADSSNATFTNGLHDLEFENAGWVFTAVGALASFNILSRGSLSSSLEILPGTAANTGFNFQFTKPAQIIDTTDAAAILALIPDPTDTPVTADALRDDLVANALPGLRAYLLKLASAKIHSHDIHSFDFNSAPAVNLGWATRIMLGTYDTTFTWTSGVVVGVSKETTLDSTTPKDTAFMTPATKALDVDAEGCYFHIAATGLLTFHCDSGVSVTAAANCAAVNVGDVLETNPHDSNGNNSYPVSIDLGFSIDVPVTVGTGTAQAYYRILEQTPNPVPTPQWTTFCDPITGVNAVPGAITGRLNAAYEVIQGAAGDQLIFDVDWIASAWSRKGRVGCPGGTC